jgi:hypothetical protein
LAYLSMRSYRFPPSERSIFPKLFQKLFKLPIFSPFLTGILYSMS